MNEQLLELLKETAAKSTASYRRDFMINDDCGGNVDDAYYMGVEDGEILFARDLLNQLGLD